MSRTKFRTAVAMVTLSVTLSSALSFAAPTVFTDISGHWAKEYIEDIYNRKITTGYPDATFKPQGNITKLETIVMISKLMGYTDNEAGYYTNKYKQELEQYKIPAWAQGATAYALFNDILLKEDLTGLVSSGKNLDAKRHEVATYIGRVLQYGAGEQIGTIYVIPYIDEMSIPTAAAPYIDLLLKKGILDKESNNGRFLPDNLISRAEVSKLASLAAKILDKGSSGNPTTPPTTTLPPTNTVRETINGEVDNVILGTKNIISIANGSKQQIYDIASNANITVDGKTATAKQLEIGQSVTAIVEDDIIIDIKAITTEEVLEGYFYYYLEGRDPKVFIKDDKDNVKGLSFTTSSKVYLMDKSVNIKDLTPGDIIYITHIDEEIIKIEAETKEKTLDGVVKSKGGSKDKYTLEVLLDDNTRETFTITSKATLKRDRKTVSFDEIKVGDEVKITKEYETVTYVNASSVQETVEGYIKKIDIGQKTQITIEKDDKTTETFVLTPNTTIMIEDEKAGIYDLRLNYQVELEIENGEVVSMETYRKLKGASYEGKVTYMDSRKGNIELQVGAREEIIVDVDDNTIYNDEDGRIIRFRDINVGDEIVIYAEDNGNYIVAKRVLVMIRR
ncbi:S-layer homology domain-containing protein [Alkaliphilus sp. B6464]|uniref:S-layer homology domain-containing protein n=1 Tax=Alkaliphilus sp. B6464 TaxID=2731219 RepID=UPI001BAD198D|nr:S-layer homology domain-containing protein [Alkaliphilus sp. B6464]QUH19143.1 S-layer homology domain-containing protein [Alkaliphilus sp. B6464]